MKADKYKEREKKYIKAQARLNQIYKEMRSIPWVKLKEPYQSGWKLIVTLRDDFMRSDKGLIVKELVDKYKVDGFTRNAKLVSDIRKKPALTDVRVRLYQRPTYQVYSPTIRPLDVRECKTLTEQQRKYFTFYPANKAYHQWFDEYRLNIPVHYLVVKIEKRMITHARDINRALLKEKAELDKFLEPYYRSCGGDYDHFYENRKEKRKAKEELRKEFESINN